MITSIIFDMDGTLFSTEPIYFECYRQAAAEMGLDFSFELFEKCIGISTEEARPLMLSYFGREVDIDKIYQGCCRRVRQHARVRRRSSQDHRRKLLRPVRCRDYGVL